MTPFRPFCLIAGLALTGVAANAAPPLEVDLALILAVDVSSSMDVEEQRLQRDGYSAAFRRADLVRAIESGPIGRIAVVYFEWAGERYQSVGVPWTVIDDGDDAMAFADALAAQPIFREAGTSISASLLFAERLFEVSGTIALRRTIDVSGDGPQNDGPAIEPVRQRLIASGITINGLPIDIGSSEGSELTDYYQHWVVGGPASFAISVTDKSQFADAIQRKLVREIASLPTSRLQVSFVSGQRSPVDEVNDKNAPR